MHSVVSIAGSDPSGGAGIQADIKTITAHKLFAETAVTALTAQNTLGVYGVEDVSPGFLADQIDAIFDDIYPAAVKIGMVSSVEIINVIADRLNYWKAKNIVLDPVMVATSGGKLIKNDAVKALVDKLIPLADLITPNLPEVEVLYGFYPEGENEIEQASDFLLTLGADAVLIKGGHEKNTANDYLKTKEGDSFWLREAHINTTNTHGTGCTLSSAIACNLAQGADMTMAVRKAKQYVTGALAQGLNLGKGNGPLNHMWEYE